jgi:cell division protein ZapA (FtsZ GTPase activity inhibitor)
MHEPQDVTVSINDRLLTIEVPIDDGNLMANIFHKLTQYVKEGFETKLMHSDRTFLIL